MSYLKFGPKLFNEQASGRYMIWEFRMRVGFVFSLSLFYYNYIAGYKSKYIEGIFVGGNVHLMYESKFRVILSNVLPPS